MLNKLAFAGALCCALASSGCSTVVSDINSVTGALSTPAATQAATNLKVGATALICDVGNVAALTNQIAAQIGAGHALIKDSENVYVISSSVCNSLGGAVVGPAIVSATAG